MSTNESFDENSFTSSEISLSRPVRFWILIILDSSSTVCAIYLLYHLLVNRTLRKSISNHVIIILLLMGLATQLIDVPLYLVFILNNGIVAPTNATTCIFWWFACFGMYNGGTVLMAWAAFERHIIVFHSQSTSTRRGRFWLHYLPVFLLLAYVFIFYTYCLLFFPCENAYEYRLPFCNALPCYQEDSFVGVWEFTMNNIVPSLLVALFSGTLLLRVVRHKLRLNQQVQWKKQRRLILQLAAISSLNIVINIPLNLVSLARLCGLPEDYGVEAQHYFYFSCYFLIFFFPFVCLIAYPELWRKSRLRCRAAYPIQDQTLVAPSVWATRINVRDR